MSESSDGGGGAIACIFVLAFICIFVVFFAAATTKANDTREWQDISDLSPGQIYVVETFKEHYDFWDAKNYYYFNVTGTTGTNNVFLRLRLDTMPQGYDVQRPQFGDKIMKTISSGVVVKVP